MSTLKSSKVFRSVAALSIATLAIITPATAAMATGGATLSFDYNTPNQLDDFDIYIHQGTLIQTTNGGINDSGAIFTNEDGDDTFAVLQPKAYYTLGPVGSSYSFSSYMKSVGNSGYSGFGFTTKVPNATNDTSNYGPFRPVDAIGVSVHGGGFVMHNKTVDTDGSWSGGNPSSITEVQSSSIGDLLNSGSPDDWYKVIFKITRTSSTKFTSRVEVWSANPDGTLIRPDGADAIYEMRNLVNSTITNSTKLYSYINFSGYRVSYFDGFANTVEGGATIQNAPNGSVTGNNTAPELSNTGIDDLQESALYTTALSALWIGFTLLRTRKRLEQK